MQLGPGLEGYGSLIVTERGNVIMIFLVDTSNGNSGFGIVSEFRVRITSLMLEA